MAINTTKKVTTMLQIIDFKHLIKCWKAITLSDSASNQVPSGFLTVYVGEARVKFLIPARFLNLPIFVHLLNIAGEEYGFKFSGGIVLPCDVGFFEQLLKFLEKNEKKYGSLEVHEFLKLIVGFDSSSCRESKNFCPKLMPLLLNKTRV